MKESIICKGRNNQVEIHPTVKWRGGMRVLVVRDNNYININEGTILNTGIIECLKSDSTILVGENCKLNGNYRCRSDNTHIEIGDYSTFNGVQLTLHEAGKISVGKDCMFSSGIKLDVSDMHGIYNVVDGTRINYPEDIIIENHVWIGRDVTIMKGIAIGCNSVIGTRSLVTSSIPSNVVAAGVPARVIKEQITWDRKRFDKLT